MIHEFNDEIKIAKQALLSAGKTLLNWKKPLSEQWKGIINPVTLADKASEERIIPILEKAFPKDIIISEEKNPLEENEVQGRRRWYLDPLDGTVNFMRQIPHWCISLALVDENDCVVVGVVYDPLKDELFSAGRGGGAYCNDKKIQVSETSELKRAVVASGFPYSFDDLSKSNLTEWNRVTPSVLTVRSLGAAALDLCEVSRGRLDVYWEQGLESWDLLAGSLICREAGATVTNLEGKELTGPSSNIIVANSTLFPKVFDLLKNGLKHK